ncbi:MAG: S8 family serine peptidase, partial [Acidobacteria bacterium]|nr:S8 family serine peptidase [Acidobacteriota bacterium]
ARNYEHLFEGADPPSFKDGTGHGTGVAMVAAGVSRDAPLASAMSGVAPKAWLGSYKVFPGKGKTRTDVIFKALDDAVADGMDVVNVSISMGWYRTIEYPDYIPRSVERAAAAGTISVWGAGTDGPERSTNTGLTGAGAITVGATFNDRFFGGSLTLDDGARFLAVPAGGSLGADSVSGRVHDVALLDGSGLACQSPAPGSLSDRIALILRGTCTFETKLNNVQQAGALAGLVYAAEDSPAPFAMGAGLSTLPAAMIGYGNGVEIKQRLSAGPVAAALDFSPNSLPADPNTIGDFSSRGPDPKYLVAPDLLAAGQDLYLAHLNGKYGVSQGTSFASPMVAGALALVRAARPGLTLDQQRSLIVNTATPLRGADSNFAPVMEQGSGSLNAEAALSSPLVVSPTSVSFGAGTNNIDETKKLVVTNLGRAADTVAVTVEPFQAGPAPTVSPAALSLEPGASGTVELKFQGRALTAGEYQGFVNVQGLQYPGALRVPYWYAIAANTATQVHFEEISSGAAGKRLDAAITYRWMDGSGIWIVGPASAVSVLSGGGKVLQLLRYDVNRVVDVDVRLGPKPGINKFRLALGSVVREVAIEGTGDAAQRYIRLGATSLAFGDVTAGQTKDLPLIVENLGTGPLTIRSIESNNATFTVAGPFPLSVPGEARATLNVRFAPAAAGQQQGRLTITHDDTVEGNLTVTTAGNGVPRAAAMPPGSGDAVASTTSAPGGGRN